MTKQIKFHLVTSLSLCVSLLSRHKIAKLCPGQPQPWMWALCRQSCGGGNTDGGRPLNPLKNGGSSYFGSSGIFAELFSLAGEATACWSVRFLRFLSHSFTSGGSSTRFAAACFEACVSATNSKEDRCSKRHRTCLRNPSPTTPTFVTKIWLPNESPCSWVWVWMILMHPL